jgi:HD-GYP domain-containing protein (c-di-GMP phosphodiesterase class II)
MSSDPRSDAPSRAPEAPRAPGSEAEVVRERGSDLLDALDARLPGSRGHADRVASWALAIAAEMFFARDRALALRETARLHAIGLLYLPADLLGRPEWELEADELRRYDEQADAAARLAAGAGIPPAPTAWLAHWRERYDAQGRLGLIGGAIPAEARVIRVACAYDACLQAIQGDGDPDPRGRAISWLAGQAGAALDPAAITALGSVVRRTG